MSLIAGVATTAATQLIRGGLSRLFGGGENIARSLSRQVGCTIAQRDANQARAMLARGVDPCTGQSTRPAPPATPTRRVRIPTRPRPAPPPRTVRVPTAPPPTDPISVAGISRQVISGVTEKLLAKLQPKAPPPPAKATQLAAPVFVPERGQFETPSIVTGQIPTQASIERARQVFVPPPARRPPVSLAISASMSGLPAVMRGAGGLIRTTTGRVSRIVMPSGRTFTRRNAANLIRRVGFEAAAVALGISVVEAAELLLTDSQTRRRRRGITGAQLATTKRTICTLKRMHADLGLSRAAPRRRKTTCR